MLARLATVLFLGRLALGSTTLSACSADNCLRAVRGTANPQRTLVATADCSSFFLATVTPATVTHYVTATQVSTITTTSTETDVVTTQILAVSTETDTVTTAISSEVFTFTGLAQRDVAARQATVTPSLIPTYASACSGSVRYSSACSCIGVMGATTTAVAPSTTIYVTQSQVTTTVVPATESDVVTTLLSSATTTVTTTTASALTISTLNCAATATHQAIINPSFESGVLSPWTFVNAGDNAGFDPPTSLTIQMSDAYDGQYSAYIHDDSGSQYDEFTLTQVVTVCPGRPYTFSFYAKANQANYCYLESRINDQYSGSFAYALTTSYSQFMYHYGGTTGGATTVTIALKDTNCFGNFHIDDITFTSS